VELDGGYAAVAPYELLPDVAALLRAMVGLLGGCLAVEHRRRLCGLVGRLAGLRGWLLFDTSDHLTAERWYTIAVSAAQESGDAGLEGWLHGARSLVPSYRHRHHAAGPGGTGLGGEPGSGGADRAGVVVGLAGSGARRAR
jgi:hypothetical protein